MVDMVFKKHIDDWGQWKQEVQLLEDLEMTKCLKSARFGGIIDCSLHHFPVAGQLGYGQVSYHEARLTKSSIN